MVTLEEQRVRDFTPLAYSIAARFYHPSLDQADLRQESLIGLVRAHRDFDPQVGAAFSTFAALVVSRHVIDVVGRAGRLKQRALTESVRMVMNDEGEWLAALEVVADPVDLERRVALREELRRALRVVDTLSPLERHSVLGISAGISAADLALAVGGNAKTIDNANQRAHRKLAEAA